jgi:hypothetical protein
MDKIVEVRPGVFIRPPAVKIPFKPREVDQAKDARKPKEG